MSAAQPDLTARLGHQIGLGDLTHDSPRYIVDDLDLIEPFLLQRLRQSEHIGDLVDDATEFGIEVVVIVDDTQVPVPRPGVDDLLIEFTR